MRLEVTDVGEGPLVVCLHGMGHSAAIWSDIATRLSVGYRAVCPDLLGHGSSPTPPDPASYQRDRCLEDLDEIISAHREVGEVPFLIGHGFGGYLALSYAIERASAIRGLALIGAAAGFESPVAQVEWNDATLKNAEGFGIDPVACSLGVIPDSMVFDRLEEVDVPTLIMIGEHDAAFNGAALIMEARIADNTLTVIEGARHNAHQTHPEEIARLLHPFIRSTSTVG